MTWAEVSEVRDTLAYYATELVTPVKCFMIHAPAACTTKLLSDVFCVLSQKASAFNMAPRISA